mmetsp:Transcript_5946/g.14229  ORF Transcript_5946/g.14229 Transcript_5946/m.14229 type:complete len:222 (+) Transcript_5946:172-837(+)
MLPCCITSPCKHLEAVYVLGKGCIVGDMIGKLPQENFHEHSRIICIEQILRGGHQQARLEHLDGTKSTFWVVSVHHLDEHFSQKRAARMRHYHVQQGLPVLSTPCMHPQRHLDKLFCSLRQCDKGVEQSACQARLEFLRAKLSQHKQGIVGEDRQLHLVGPQPIIRKAMYLWHRIPRMRITSQCNKAPETCIVVKAGGLPTTLGFALHKKASETEDHLYGT